MATYICKPVKVQCTTLKYNLQQQQQQQQQQQLFVPIFTIHKGMIIKKL